MIDNANVRLVGLFVLGAVALIVILTLTLGGGYYFSQVKPFVSYFEGSVNGLDIGAPVKLKGVEIGRVKDVLVQYDLEKNRVLTPVLMEIDREKIMESYDSDSTRHHHPALLELTERGLRARLAAQSLVTGKLYVDINFLPQEQGKLVGVKTLGVPEIPTVASSQEEIEKTLKHLASEVREMPLKETVDALHGAIGRAEQLLSKPETAASIDNLNQTLKDLQTLVHHLDARIGTLGQAAEATAHEGETLIRTLNQRLPPLLESTQSAMGSAQGALATVEILAEPDSELSRALRDVSRAAQALHNLADNLERHPDSLLFGRADGERD